MTSAATNSSHPLKRCLNSRFCRGLYRCFRPDHQHDHHHSHLAHHTKSVLFLASVMVILNWMHLMDGLDALFLYAANTGTYKAGEPFTGKPDDTSKPVLVDIGNSAFEQEFMLRSPLDREKLRQLLLPILAHHPAVLAVDLDLSPVPTDGSPGEDAQQALNDLLAEHACCDEEHPDPDCNPSPGGCCTRIVLIRPFPSDTQELLDADVQWMGQMCIQGIEFANPDLLQSLGVVLRQYKDADSLAHLAWKAAGEPRSTDAGDSGFKLDRSMTLCQRLARDDARFLQLGATDPSSDYGRSHKKRGKTLALNTEFSEQLDHFHLYRLKELTQLPSLRNRVVFVGGSYGLHDRYQTPFGNMPGVLIHAAEYHSRVSPITESKPLVVALEIILGLIFAYVFTWLWQRYFELKQDPQRKDAASVVAWGILLLVAAIFYAMVESAAYLLGHNLWLNPTPLVLGLLVDSILGGLEKEAVGTDHETHRCQKPAASRLNPLRLFIEWTRCLPQQLRQRLMSLALSLVKVVPATRCIGFLLALAMASLILLKII